MQHRDRVMLAHVKLARLSEDRQQLTGRDRFLVLAGAAACRAGWPDVAARCRALVLEHNPQHLIGRYETFPAALREAEFAQFLKQQDRFCGYERAEHLLRELGVTPDLPNAEAEISAGEYAFQLLSGAADP